MPERTEEPTSLQVSDTVLEALPADSAITTAVRERMTASETAQAHPSVVEQTKAGIDPLPVLRCSERTRQTPAYLKDFDLRDLTTISQSKNELWDSLEGWQSTHLPSSVFFFLS